MEELKEKEKIIIQEEMKNDIKPKKKYGNYNKKVRCKKCGIQVRNDRL